LGFGPVENTAPPSRSFQTFDELIEGFRDYRPWIQFSWFRKDFCLDPNLVPPGSVVLSILLTRDIKDA
jgi:hypothetical protein